MHDKEKREVDRGGIHGAFCRGAVPDVMAEPVSIPGFAMKFLAWILGAGLLGAILSTCSAPAHAHSWYDAYCCSDTDCIEIPYYSVQMNPDGSYTVKLSPQEHFLVPEGRVYERTFAADEVRESQDASWHACVYSGQIRCVYKPPEMF